ncbi:MAG: BlaI/MecI/CopY family transcriptional regulator [Bacteroidaceae bacterium]|jgi:predicted transcriptional regulator|nr:BlaI/MecI/CopY family transcriptional regulator [Bacteroidaceae bacterium]
MKRKDNTLTKVEFEIMNILWDLDTPACAWDVVNSHEDPKPAYTTVATYLKILHDKGYLDYFKTKGEGKTHKFVPLVSRAEYTRKTMLEMKKSLFGNSLKSMFSYFIQEEKLSTEEIQELLKAVENGNEKES